MLPDTTLMIVWFAAVFSFIVLVFLLLGFTRNRVDERISELGEDGDLDPNPGNLTAGRTLQNGFGPTGQGSDQLSRGSSGGTSRNDRKEGMRDRMMRAGLYNRSSMAAFFILRVLLLVMPVGVGVLASSTGVMTLTAGLFWGGVAGVAGTLAPGFLLDHIKAVRQTKIRRALPDALDVMVTVDEGDEDWTGNEGVVTTILERDKLACDHENGVAVVCGPPIMMKFVTLRLLSTGYSPDRIYLSMEKNMSCGVGKCGHCRLGPHYACKDGPVFTYDQMEPLKAVWD